MFTTGSARHPIQAEGEAAVEQGVDPSCVSVDGGQLGRRQGSPLENLPEAVRVTCEVVLSIQWPSTSFQG